MASAIDSRFDLLLRGRVRGLAGLGLQAQEYALKAVVNIGRATAQRAAELTPRSDGSGPHIADGWTTEEKASGADVRVRVHNASPKATEKLKLADGSATPYTLLDILEYGSDPHTIEPVNGPSLVFFWGKVGRVVHAKKVNHPGTRPYSMMALARVRANVDMKKAIDALRVVVRLAMLGNTARLRSPNPFGG